MKNTAKPHNHTTDMRLSPENPESSGSAPSTPVNPDQSQPPAQPRQDQADIFADLAALRIDRGSEVKSATTPAVLRVPVRKPSNEWFVQTHPSESFRLATGLIALKEQGDFYLVAPALRDELAAEPTYGEYLLFTALARPGGNIFLWPIRLPSVDGRLNTWSSSALEIAGEVASKSWVRVTSDRSLGAYRAAIAPADGVWGIPRWPDLPFNKLVELGFRDRVISTFDHPVLRRLRGEA